MSDQLTPLPKKPDDEKKKSVQPNAPSTLGLNPPPQADPIALEDIPERVENIEDSPALYQDTADTQKYFENTNDNPHEDIFTLKKKLEEKEKEVNDIFNTFTEIKASYETLNVQNQNLSTQIETLKSSITMKETQIQTLTDTIRMKDEQIAMKNSQINMKEDQIQVYVKTLEDKNKILEQATNDPNKVDKSLFEAKMHELEEKSKSLNELNERIKEYEEEADLLKGDIEAADEEVEELTNKIQLLSSEAKDAVYLNRKQVIEKINKILISGLHNINLTVPTILDLTEIELYEVKSSVNLKISCDIDMTNPKHSELLEEYQVFDNISLRIYDSKDRWSILKDGELLFLGIVGTENEKFLTFSSGDSQHIKIFSSLVMESWLRGRKI